MKILLYSISVLLLASCAYDNLDAPKLQLKGNLVYEGEPINVSFKDVSFQLWEPGWQLKTQIDVNVDQDGSYSALLFPAKYKLVIPKSQGPFMSVINSETQSDTILIDFGGSKTLDIEVKPYYMVRNPEIKASGSVVSGSLKLEKIITDENAKDIEFVELYVCKTYFVDGRNKVTSTKIDGGNIADVNNINLLATVPTMTPTQNYVFARIGVKMVNVEDMIFSPVTKVTLE